jgi:protoporphyrinogen oxidase
MCDAAVVGGGILGLAVAQRLRQRGDHVTVFEAAPEIGGLASAWRLGDVVWDRHYHVILASDRRTRDTLESIGLEDELAWVEIRNGYYGGEGVGLRPFSTASDFLRLPGLHLTDKIRLGTTILRGARVADGAPMERVHVERWLRKRSGDRAFEAFWVPLLRAKLGDAWTDTSAAFIWATIRRLYAARRSGLAKEQFGYVRHGGYARVFERYADVLRAEGVKLEADTPVRAIRPDDGRVRVDLNGGSEVFDRVVVTTAAPLASRLCPDLTPEEHARLQGVRYMGVVCASLLLKRPLDGYYLTYITDSASPFTAVVEMTAFVDPSELNGQTLVYLPKYLAPDDRLLTASDDEVRAEFFPYLQRMYPRLTDDDVLAFQVSRVRQAFALPTLRYSSRMPSSTTSIPGVQLLGSAQLPFATLNVNDTLSLVKELR